MGIATRVPRRKIAGRLIAIYVACMQSLEFCNAALFRTHPLVTVRLPLVPTKCRRIPPIPADYRLFPLNQLTPALCRREILAHSAEYRCMPSTAAYYRSIPTNAEGYRQSTLVPVKCRSMPLFTAESRRIPPKSAHCRTATRYQTLPLNAVLYR